MVGDRSQSGKPELSQKLKKEPNQSSKYIAGANVLCIDCMIHLQCSFFFFIMRASLFHSPNKTEFIKAKYQMLAYVHRMPCREDDSVTAKDLSKVWSSSPRSLCYNL